MAEMKRERPQTFSEFSEDDTRDFNKALKAGLKAAAFKGFEQRADNSVVSVNRAKNVTLDLIKINLRYLAFGDNEAYRIGYIDNPIEDMLKVLTELGFESILVSLKKSATMRDEFLKIMQPILEEALNETFVVPEVEL